MLVWFVHNINITGRSVGASARDKLERRMLSRLVFLNKAPVILLQTRFFL